MIEVILKLVLAVVFGGIIGLEREFSQKPAGLRTNILICIGATMMMALSGIMLGGAASGSADALRIAAGVITGMGFIGAGTIMQAGGHVHGLTTASTLWAVAGLGLFIGAGYYAFAAVYTGILVITLFVFPIIERMVPHRASFHYLLRVESIEAVDELRRVAAVFRIKLEELSFRKDKESAVIGFHVVTSVVHARAFREKILAVGDIIEAHVD
jgi:putative Mg2+ transporter-C (MgtC) family protein